MAEERSPSLARKSADDGLAGGRWRGSRHSRRCRSDQRNRETGDPCQWHCDAKYPAKSILRVYLQRGRRADCCRRTLPVLRPAAQPNDCRRGDEFQLRFSYRECAATAILQTVNELRPPNRNVTI